MVDLTLDFDKADLARFDDTLKRFARERNKSAEQAIKYGVINLIGSLRSSTRIAKERRKVYVPKTKAEKKMRDKFGRRLFYVEGYDANGSLSLAKLWAFSKKDALRRKATKIVNRGLAKLSWGWALKDLYGKNLPQHDVHKSGVKILGRTITTRKIKSGSEQAVEIINELNYISKALKTKGKTAVNTAMQRATKSIKKKLDDNLKKAGF